MSEELRVYAAKWLQIAISFGHDMIREEYVRKDGLEYAHYKCLHCGALLGVRKDNEGLTRSCIESAFERCGHG